MAQYGFRAAPYRVAKTKKLKTARGQSASCNRFHKVISAADRVETDPILESLSSSYDRMTGLEVAVS